jgi:hypothetical protein
MRKSEARGVQSMMPGVLTDVDEAAAEALLARRRRYWARIERTGRIARRGRKHGSRAIIVRIAEPEIGVGDEFSRDVGLRD